jgi:hypothetical protein
VEERVPVGLLDAMFLGVAGDHPWTVHAEVDLPDDVEPGALATAARRVVGAHPMLRARLAPDGAAWLIGGGPPPTVELFDESTGSLAVRREDLLSAAGDMPAARTVRFCAYRRGGGPTTLLLVAHHAALDGVGARVALEDWIAALQGRTVAPDDTWRQARRLECPPVTPEAAAAARDRQTEVARTSPWRLGRAVPEPSEGPLYGVLEVRTGAISVPARSSVTTSDVAVGCVAHALRALPGRHDDTDRPLLVGVPINLRPLRSWAAGVVNASVPATIRIDDDTLPSAVCAVAQQRRSVRAGILAPSVRALLGDLRGRRSAPVRLKVGLARLSTMVSTMGDTTVAWEGAPVHPWGTAPAAPWTGATFAVVEEPTAVRLSIRYLRAVLGEDEARGILTRAAADVPRAVEALDGC